MGSARSSPRPEPHRDRARGRSGIVPVGGFHFPAVVCTSSPTTSLNLQSFLLIPVLVEYAHREGFSADGRRDAFCHGAHNFYIRFVLPRTFAAENERRENRKPDACA